MDNKWLLGVEALGVPDGMDGTTSSGIMLAVTLNMDNYKLIPQLMDG